MIRNKIFTGLAAAALLFLLAGCATTDDGVKEVVFDSADTDLAESVETEEEQEVTEVNAVVVETEEQSSFLVEATAPAGREGKKNYTGWVSTSIRPVTNTIGNIKINARPKQGTFSIAVINSDQKAIPVFSTANEYTTTSFYLKAGKKIVKLCDDSGVVSAAKKTAKGLKIRYTIDKVAVVIIDFECFASKEGYAEDSIKITSTILSQSKKKNDFALKLLMDTVLGETDRHHFYTSDGSAVKKEVSYSYYEMKNEKYITAKNAKASMQIILSGADITDIQSLALANYATLDTRKWDVERPLPVHLIQFFHIITLQFVFTGLLQSLNLKKRRHRYSIFLLPQTKAFLAVLLILKPCLLNRKKKLKKLQKKSLLNKLQNL